MGYITYKQAETWVDINGYEGSYQVSNLGNVRSLDRIVAHPKWGTMKRKGKQLKPTTNSDGYLVVSLYRNGAQKRVAIHRLVAEAFCEKHSEDVEVNHKNEDKTDNSFMNLEWISHKENVRHGTGIVRRSKSISVPVVAVDDEGRERRFSSMAEAARSLGLLRGEISRCCNGIYKQYKGFRWRFAEEV